MPDLVLDAWAIMVWLKGEQPAADRMGALLEEAGERRRKLAMNIANLGEVFYLCAKAKNQAYGHRVLEALRPRVVKVSASDELVMLAATLKSRNAISTRMLSLRQPPSCWKHR